MDGEPEHVREGVSVARFEASEASAAVLSAWQVVSGIQDAVAAAQLRMADSEAKLAALTVWFDEVERRFHRV